MIPTTRRASVGSSRSECRDCTSCLLPTAIAASTGYVSSVRVRPRAVKPMPTKSAVPSDHYDLRPEYDLSKLTGGVRGKYYDRATAVISRLALRLVHRRWSHSAPTCWPPPLTYSQIKALSATEL